MSVYRLKASISRIPISGARYCNLLRRFSYLHLFDLHISQYTPAYAFTTNPHFHSFLSPFRLHTQPPKMPNISILPVQINTLLHISTVSISFSHSLTALTIYSPLYLSPYLSRKCPHILLFMCLFRFLNSIAIALQKRILYHNANKIKSKTSTVKKGKAIPLLAWSGPGGSRKLRFPDFMTTAQGGGKVVSLKHRPHLPPGNSPGTHYC